MKIKTFLSHPTLPPHTSLRTSLRDHNLWFMELPSIRHLQTPYLIYHNWELRYYKTFQNLLKFFQSYIEIRGQLNFI